MICFCERFLVLRHHNQFIHFQTNKNLLNNKPLYLYEINENHDEIIGNTYKVLHSLLAFWINNDDNIHHLIQLPLLLHIISSSFLSLFSFKVNWDLFNVFKIKTKKKKMKHEIIWNRKLQHSPDTISSG